MIGHDTFDAIYSALVDARCEVRIGQAIISQALTSGLMRDREQSEQGLFEKATMNVRIRTSDEDARNPINIGTLIDVKHVGDWVHLRVMGKKQTAGVTMLSLQTPYEQ